MQIHIKSNTERQNVGIQIRKVGDRNDRKPILNAYINQGGKLDATHDILRIRTFFSSFRERNTDMRLSQVMISVNRSLIDVFNSHQIEDFPTIPKAGFQTWTFQTARYRIFNIKLDEIGRSFIHFAIFICIFLLPHFSTIFLTN